MSNKKPLTPSQKQANYRKRMQAQGLRMVQIWVPDTRAKGFAAECRRQSLLMAKSDRADKDLAHILKAGAAWVLNETR